MLATVFLVSFVKNEQAHQTRPSTLGMGTNSRCQRKCIGIRQAWSNNSSKCSISFQQSVSWAFAESELFSSCCSVFSMFQFFLLLAPLHFTFKKKKKGKNTDCLNRYTRGCIFIVWGSGKLQEHPWCWHKGWMGHARINSPVRGKMLQLNPDTISYITPTRL